MAATGVLLIGFVIAHMAGNLQVFAGPEKINAYAKTLRDLGPLLWVARIGLLVVFAAHIVTAIQLKIENRMARPVPYSKEATIAATITSRTMVFTGILILAYVVYHLLHFTLFVTNPEFTQLKDAGGHHDVYRMMIAGFSNGYVATAYIVAMLLLGMHLHHGGSSFFQSMGWNSPKYRKITRLVGPVLAVIVTLGYVSIPLAVWIGWLK